MKKYILIVFAALTIIAVGCSDAPSRPTDSGSGVTTMEIDSDSGE